MDTMPVTVVKIPNDPGQVAGARVDFPILAQQIHGHPLVYLDNAATTQKPRQVIDAERHYYEQDNANIHRAVHTLSQRATDAYEQARDRVRAFINAADRREVVFTRGTTESINLVAASFGRANLKPGDEVVLTTLEHHSNIVPWQIVAGQTGANVVAAPINAAGEVPLEEFARRLSPKTKIVSTLWVSNSLGTINPVAEMIALTRRHAPQAVFVVDAAQWVAHGPTDVRAIDCDFLAFSSHKLFGPTGVGVLYGKRALLEAMPPYQGGGDMIETVAFEHTTYAPLPNKFEAGTPNIAGVVGLAAAIEYVQSIGFDAIAAHEHNLLEYATARMGEVPGLRILGQAAQKSAVISFVIEGISSLDIGIELDAQGIAVRTGHHCCMPLMKRLGVSGTARASFSLYNTREEVDRLVEVLKWIARTHKPSPPTPPAPVGAAPPTVEFPAATADSPDAAAAAIIADFEFLQDRNERTQYILDLGATLPKHFDLLKTLTPELPGCMSKVYLVGRRVPGSPDRFEFIADSDAAIVRGEIALLQRVFSGQMSSNILAFDVEQFFHRLGLEHLLTVQRRSGLASMVAKIRQLASTEK